MDIRQLEVFLTVIEYHSFSKAAEKLYLTQPTVSAHIGSLEKELGTRLIVRSPNGAFPTEDGALLKEYANDILALHDNALNWFKSRHEDTTAAISIAASTVPAKYILPRIMAVFCRENPGISFQVIRSDSKTVIEDISSRRAEIGIAGARIDNKNCDFEEFYEDRLVFITPDTEHYRKMKDKNIFMRQLTYEPFLIREAGSGTRLETEHFLRQVGIDPKTLHIAAQFNDPESIKQAVSQGVGIAVVSELGVLDYERFQMLQVLRFPHPCLKRKLYIVTHKEHSLSEPARKLLDFARNFRSFILSQKD